MTRRLQRDKYAPPRYIDVGEVGKVKAHRLRVGDLILTSSGKLVPVERIDKREGGKWRCVHYNGRDHYQSRSSIVERVKQ